MNNFTDIRCKSTGKEFDKTKWLITFERGKKAHRITVAITVCITSSYVWELSSYCNCRGEPDRREWQCGGSERGWGWLMLRRWKCTGRPCYWFVIEVKVNSPGWHPDSWPEGRGRLWNRDGATVIGPWTSKEKLRFLAVLFKKAWGKPVILFQLSCVTCREWLLFIWTYSSPSI